MPNENNNIIKLSNNIDSIHASSVTTMDDMPEFERRLDGSVKIIEKFDIDIENGIRTDKQCCVRSEVKYGDKNEERYINNMLYNSCRDVLGNCIVSGNGNIDEECLCAKMTADDQQMIAQEIEDITPCPKKTWLSERL